MDTPNKPAPMLRLERLERGYTQGNRRIDVLKGASASFFPSEAVALLGPSGAGKSTLLHIAGLLERPDRGAVLINGVDCVGLNDKEQTRIRRMEVGFVYQFHHLLPEFSALENVMMPALIRGIGAAEAKSSAERSLADVGLAGRIHHRPGELSGGEQQRVAVARALMLKPAVILADEPTGNLDEHTGEAVHDLLHRINKERGITFVIVTHNDRLALRADRVLRMAEGTLHPER